MYLFSYRIRVTQKDRIRIRDTAFNMYIKQISGTLSSSQKYTAPIYANITGQLWKKAEYSETAPRAPKPLFVKINCPDIFVTNNI